MTANLSEVAEHAGTATFNRSLRGEQLAVAVLKAVETGSKTPSPFVHFSWKFEEARHWWVKGRSYRNVQDNIICRVDVQALSQASDLSATLDLLSYVDLSTQRSSQPYIAPHVGADAVQDRLSVLGHAHKVAEVLVAWRGHLPKALFEVVHEDTGEFLRPLDETVPGDVVHNSDCSYLSIPNHNSQGDKYLYIHNSEFS